MLRRKQFFIPRLMFHDAHLGSAVQFAQQEPASTLVKDRMILLLCRHSVEWVPEEQLLAKG